MTLLLWVLAYLAVGFVVAVAVERYWPGRPIVGPPILFAQMLWPLVLGVLGLALIIDRFEGLGGAYERIVRSCARRLP